MTAIIILGMKYRRFVELVFVLAISTLALVSSVVQPDNQYEQARAFTRSIEFDFLGWTLNALGIKLGQAALGVEAYLPPQQRPEIVLDYLDLVGEIGVKEAELADIYANPDIPDPFTASADLRSELDQLYTRRAQLQPLAEEILQDQIATTAAESGLALGGETLPPVLYHTTPLPHALIISPREVIRQDADISISPDLTIDQMSELEDKVDKSMNVSSLVVGVGGIGLYPTMVMQTTDINWLAEVISHEWVHNFLTLRPLGLNYMTDSQMRIVNETVASIAGKELGQAVIARYYPEFMPVPTPTPTPPGVQPTPQPTENPPGFDFRAEMHITRLAVDSLLAEGKIEQAETYMELRRRVFWENGYHIRKLNQAYFAFHGAYADQPGGAAGASEDPVGEAVRALRANSASLAEFLNRISWMWTFKQLQQAVSKN
jgi:hypothetical protein